MMKINANNNYEFPFELLTDEPHIELFGNNKCLVDGLKKILEYRSDKIKFIIGSKVVTFIGENLYIDALNVQGALIKGIILSVEFSDVK